MTELSLTSCCVPTLWSGLRITQLYMRKHTRCCSLQTSTANPYSRGTSSQTVPSSSPKGTRARPVWPVCLTNNRAHPHSWQQITDQPHDTKQIKTQLHTNTYWHAHIHKSTEKTQTVKKHKARATHVMLARASTTSLACAQSPQPLSDAQGVQRSKGVRTRRLDYTTLSEYLAHYPKRNMMLPSSTLRCCTPPFSQWQMFLSSSSFFLSFSGFEDPTNH